MRTGIFGGSFNPVHYGHMHIISNFMKQVDRLLVIPALIPPHKQHEGMATANDRYNMCRIAIDEMDEGVEVSDIEIERGGSSYTSDTLSELSRQYPDDRLTLFMGEDMFVTLEQWRKPELIMNLADICVAPRSSDGLSDLEEIKVELEHKYAARISFLSMDFLDISSTEIRDRLANGLDVSGLLPRAVEKYIKDHCLYRQTGGQNDIN